MAYHVKLGVSLGGVTDPRMQGESRGLNVLSCIGNEALIVEGDAKGERGVVVGKHGVSNMAWLTSPLKLWKSL